MKNKLAIFCGVVLIAFAVTLIVTGCGGGATQQPTQSQQGRFQVYATANGTFLVDTHTGDNWLYANLIWLSTARAQLPPELHQQALNALFQSPPIQNPGTGPDAGGGTRTP